MLQDMSSCLLFLTQLLPVSPLFSTFPIRSPSPRFLQKALGQVLSGGWDAKQRVPPTSPRLDIS